jgi:hypothetical protein
LKEFPNELLIQLADDLRAEVHDLHASLSSQIFRLKELALVDACYDPTTVVPYLSAPAKSNV